MADNQKSATPVPTAHDIRAAMERVRAGSVLRTRARQFELLNYLVCEELEGRGDRLKGYSIGLDVFGQNSDCDAGNKSTVRVEMHRLRQALDLYYLTEGKDETVRIVLEPGAYKPKFIYVDSATQHDSETPPAPESSTPPAPDEATPDGHDKAGGERLSWLFSRHALVAVMGLILIAGAAPHFFTARGSACDVDRPTLTLVIESGVTGADLDPLEFLRKRLSSALQLYPLVTLESANRDCRRTPAFVLLLDIAEINGARTFVASLQALHHENVLWSRAFVAPEDDDVDGISLISARIAYRLMQADGVIPPIAQTMDWESEQEKADYACVLGAHELFSDESHLLTPPVHECLSDQIARASPHADVYGLFAALNYYYRQGWLPGDVAKADERYNDAMAKGRALNPQDREVLINDLRQARESDPVRAERIRRIKLAVITTLHDDPHLLNQVARSLGYGLGDWEEAKTIVDRALAIVEDSYFIAHTAYSASIAVGDWSRAQQSLAHFSHTGMENIAILNLAVALHFNQPEEFVFAMDVLARKNLKSKSQIANYAEAIYPNHRLLEQILPEFEKLDDGDFPVPLTD
ncbi:MAG: hypothetical protein KDA46_00565 [Parvularculaceae bacterium]|nr:hypothetical protein [Parvularculaceae bacterium]